MEKYHLFTEIEIDGEKSYHIFTCDNLYEAIGRITVLYKNGHSVELYLNEEDKSIMIYKHEQGKKEEGILRLED